MHIIFFIILILLLLSLTILFRKKDLIKISGGRDDKFLYKIMNMPNIRMIISFDDTQKRKVDYKYIYKKTITNISYKQGRNIYYQIATLNGYPINDYPRGSNYSIIIYFTNNSPQTSNFITKNFYSTIATAKLFLNKNSLDILKYQDLDKFISPEMDSSRHILDIYLNFLNKEVPLKDQEDIVAINGIVAYILGLRKIQDIDITINNNKNIEDKVKNIESVDAYNINPSSNKFEKIMIERFKYIVNGNYKKVYTDDKNFFYFMGMKVISLDLNMKLRYLRQRPKAVGEIIAFNIKMENKYPIPSIPKNRYVFLGMQGIYNKPVSFGEKEINFGKKIFKIKDSKIEKENINENKYLNTLLFYLRSLYKIFKFNNINELKEYI